MGAPAVTTTLNSSLRKDVQVSGPRSFFSRAIGNLLRNAARHARSEIRLSVRLTADGGQVEIRVEDDGDGMSRELADHLFDPFVSGTGLGVGLGLSFARWGIERLGGAHVRAGPLDPLRSHVPRRPPAFHNGWQVRLARRAREPGPDPGPLPPGRPLRDDRGR